MAGFVLHADLFRDSGVQETGDEYFIVRTFNVTLPLISSAADQQNQALTATGVPNLGDPHPTLPLAICSKRDVSPNMNDSQACWVNCTYRWPRGVGKFQLRYEYGTTLRQIQTSYTWDGRPLNVWYRPPAVIPGTDVQPIQSLLPSVPKLFPISFVKFTFFQKGNPGQWIQAVTGKCNSSFWTVGGGDPTSKSQNQIYTWLCTQATASIVIYGTSLDNSWFEISGTLEYNKDTWINTLFFTNFTGNIPPDIVKNQPKLPDLLAGLDFANSIQYPINGMAAAQLYQPIDFNIAFPFNGPPQTPTP